METESAGNLAGHRLGVRYRGVPSTPEFALIRRHTQLSNMIHGERFKGHEGTCERARYREIHGLTLRHLGK